MVLMSDDGGSFGVFAFGIMENFKGTRGVSFHDGKFIFSEFTGFMQNRVGDSDFTNIMHWRGMKQDIGIFIRQTFMIQR